VIMEDRIEFGAPNPHPHPAASPVSPHP